MSKVKTLDQEVINDILDYAWMELGDVSKLKYNNALVTNPLWNDKEKIPELVVELCRNPDYLHFVCKYILNIDLLPFQVAILQTLWTTPLPLFIGSRGSSKSYLISVYIILRLLLHQGCKVAVVGAALRQSLVLYNYVNAIWENAPVLRDICGGKKEAPKRELHAATFSPGISHAMFLPMGTGDKIRGMRACVDKNTIIETDRGLIRIQDAVNYMDDLRLLTHNKNWISPDAWVKTKLIDVYEVITMGGFTIKCSDIHKLYTTKGFKDVTQLTTDDRLVFTNNYKFPEKYIEIDGVKLDENLAWLLGILVAEGSVSNRHTMTIKMTDEKCIQRIHDAWLKFKPDIYVGRYHQETFKDKRGWICKATFEAHVCNIKVRELLYKFGLEYKKARNKSVPWAILQSPKSVVQAFLTGIFEGDGSMFLYKDKTRENNLGSAFYSGSEQLAQEIQILLSKFDIFSTRNSRESKLSDKPQYMIRCYGLNAFKLYELLKIEKWRNAYENSGKGDTNNYISERDSLKIKSVIKLDKQDNLYDFSVPHDHSFVGNCFINHNTYIVADELASISDEVFNVVVRGFAAVKSDGLHMHVVKTFKEQTLRDMGLKMEKDKTVRESELGSNQILMAGTAYYQFNHIYRYYSYYRAVIQSGGDKNYIRQLFPDMILPDTLNPSDYAIIRLPCEKLPPGMMDQKILDQGRATMDSVLFDMEYKATFPSDSDGFFLASQLNTATCPIESINGKICFGPKLFGDHDKKYAMGIDPASENDNFTINILELNGLWRGVVYQWSTNRKSYEDLLRQGLTDIKDYNTFVLKHIRSLMKRFNIVIMICDAGGGGLSLRESLKDPEKLEKDELPVYDADEPENKKYQGHHILRMMQFSDASWRCNAHYGLKKDILDKKLLFPYFDVADIEVQNLKDSKEGKSYDTLEDCYLEIEQCKRETTFIKHQMTPNGQEKWDVPQIKGLDADELRKTLKRDRFTSLLLSNWGARVFIEEDRVQVERDLAYGDVVQNIIVAPQDRAFIDYVDMGGGRKIVY